VDVRSLSGLEDYNWLLLFPGVGRCVRTVLRLSRSLPSLGEVLGLRLVRGVEMYGPDLFLIPNRRWSIAEEGRESVVITDGSESLEIPREFLVPALRRPALYADRFVVRADHYLLSVPPVERGELPADLRRYLEWGEELGVPALKFGRLWYSHVRRQVESKRPFGRLFLPDKVDSSFGRRGVFSVVTEGPTAATKNFYLARVSLEEAAVLSVWFNSSLFLCFFLAGGRRISGTWTRMLEEDYLRLPAPDPARVPRRLAEEAVSLLREASRSPAPPVPEQEGWAVREELDRLAAEALGLSPPEMEEARGELFLLLRRGSG